jgi:L-ascorbate metabolism protein UlaG (beta-lactamase superfamily)
MTKLGKELIDDINQYKAASGEAAFWWIGQHSFILKIGETICYIDPYLSESPDRRVPPLLKPSEVTNATLVLGTHDHGDHIDRGSLPGILDASPNARLIIPQLLRDRLIDDLKLDAPRVLGIDVDLPIEIAGLAINAVPAAHEFLDRDPNTGLHPFLGFVVEASDFCFYHAGDTCIYEGIHAILRRWQIDLAFLPINGRDAHRLKNNIIGNMTYQEAADLAGSLNFATTVPAHFEMFEMNSIDPQLFEGYMQVKYPRSHTLIPRHGERTIIKSRANR